MIPVGTPEPDIGQLAEITVVPLDTLTLGDRSYLVHDGEVAFVVDPQRDIDRVLARLDEQGLRLTHVFESHIHNDYVTGGFALARRTGAAYLVNAEDQVSFERTPVRDGEVVQIGPRMRVTAVATPGHTFTHLSYLLADARTGEQFAVFSGGSLLYGATGRPDLLGPQHTDVLARAQHASARKLAEMLPDAAEVFPTHGFGSFCSATQSEAANSTIGPEKAANPVLTQREEIYVRELLAGLNAYPAYYAHMAPANAAGPSEPDLSPPGKADPAEIRRRIDAGEWVVDLRDRTVFAAGHVPGSLNFGLDGSLATYLGWLIDWGAPLTLLGETADDVAQAQRELVRIGIDRPAAAATGQPQDWVAGTGREPTSFAMATFADLARVRHHRAVTVLDVRRTDEFGASRIEGAVNIPLHELPKRLAEVPAGEVWVHCAAGYRASIAASFLAAAGRHLVAIDDAFDNTQNADLPVTTPHAPMTLAVIVVAGALIGLSLGALGGGGSVLTVPALVYGLGQSAAQATTGSLLVVGITSLAGAITAYRSGNVLLTRGLAFGAVAIGGAAVGAKASGLVPEPVLLAAFAALLLAVAAVMAARQFRSRRGQPEAQLDSHIDGPIIVFRPSFACHCPRALTVLVTATAVGLLTGFLGVGGGFLVVPALVLALGLPMAYAAGTSLVVITITSASALAVRAGTGAHPSWGVVALLTAVAVAGGWAGARLTARTDTSKLQAAFTALLLLVVGYTAWRALPALIPTISHST